MTYDNERKEYCKRFIYEHITRYGPSDFEQVLEAYVRENTPRLLDREEIAKESMYFGDALKELQREKRVAWHLKLILLN